LDVREEPCTDLAALHPQGHPPGRLCRRRRKTPTATNKMTATAAPIPIPTSAPAVKPDESWVASAAAPVVVATAVAGALLKSVDCQRITTP
jgi:hypothetical protein